MLKTIALPLIAAVAVTSANAEAVELKYNTLLAGVHVLVKGAMTDFSARVTEQSKGDVTFKLMPGGVLSKGNAALDTLRDGIAGSAMVIDLYERKSLPMNSVLSDLAMFGTDTLVMAAATNEEKLLRCDECRKEMLKASSIPLAFASTTPYELMCKDQAVTSRADMKGKKVRATGPWALFLKDMGMVPVNISATETFEAMQRGQVDCTAGPVAWLKSYSLMDVARVVTDLPIGTYHGNLVLGISVEAWNRLTPRAHTVIRKNLASLVADGAFGYEHEGDEARAEGKAKGVRFVQPAPDLHAAYKTYLKTEVERVITTGEKAGLKNSRVQVEDYLKTVAKWEKIVAETKRDKKAYTEALEREIFSKLNLN